ncbi:MAG: transporter [Verrucomicrobiota bacterium]|nr:transporter [Verrucomicrobiota bacterium]
MLENFYRKNSFWIALLFHILGNSSANAQDTGEKIQSRSSISAPAKPLRELSTDRPDKTESPYTVDIAHFQIEMDLVSFSYDKHNSDRNEVREESFSFANINLKIGLASNADFQLVIPAYNRLRTRDRATGSIQKNSGMGDLTARLKINFWGDDVGQTAFGVMPFVKFPTRPDSSGNNAVEGGIIFPLSVKLPGGWGLGAMTEFDFNKDASSHDYHPEFINSITLSHSLFSQLDGYAEFFSSVSAEKNSEWIGTADFGLVYQVNKNLQLDAGLNVGITRAADDLNPFLGVSFRF